MYFFCIACFRPSRANKNSLGREGTNCYWCRATSRDRSMLLNIHITFISKVLRNPRRIPKIVGISDGYLMERVLKLLYGPHYTNYHFHQKPRLDITRVNSEFMQKADIISCSEVLEHVAPPVEFAFDGLYTILKSNGVLVLSVPHSDYLGSHIEHFPPMKHFEIFFDGCPRLVGKLIDGETITFDNLVFHGGIGSTLEFRVFSQSSLENFLLQAGFTSLKKTRNFKILGIDWEPWSRTWSATKVQSKN